MDAFEYVIIGQVQDLVLNHFWINGSGAVVFLVFKGIMVMCSGWEYMELLLLLLYINRTKHNVQIYIKYSVYDKVIVKVILCVTPVGVGMNNILCVHVECFSISSVQFF